MPTAPAATKTGSTVPGKGMSSPMMNAAAAPRAHARPAGPVPHKPKPRSRVGAGEHARLPQRSSGAQGRERCKPKHP
eukprot:10876158-Alexandrium_andersonii.AAC.1